MWLGIHHLLVFETQQLAVTTSVMVITDIQYPDYFGESQYRNNEHGNGKNVCDAVFA